MSTTRRVKAMGVWMDPLTTQRSLVHPTLTVEQVVGAVKQDVISNVEKAYGLTLDDTANMDTQYFPHANPSDSVSSFPQLVSLITPTEAQSRHIKERLSSLQAAEKENQDLRIRNRDLANSLVDTLNTPTSSTSKPKSGKGKAKGKEKPQQEEDNDSDSIKELRGMIEQLHEALAKEKAERAEELAKEKAERIAEMAKEKADRADDIEALRQVTVSLIPLHLRVLLDLGRKKVLDILNADSWEDLRGERNVYQLADVVMSGLAKVQSRPSRGAISFLCSYNNVRRQGNAAAHTAAEDEIRAAVMSKPIGSQDRKFLEQIFSFIFLHPV
ncbi:hypothetical protein F5I97DRAFT_478209 [Phlebopus sp. FC_14]|nr:hypothetical protein F5I97DRAFT_478209 [Phlebopus sp. FC_14]